MSLVSFVLNGKQKQHRVSDEVAERIKKIAKDLNYKPNVFAKSLRDGRSRAIGVVVSDISNPFFANIARQIEATAEKYDYMVQFSSSDESAARTSKLIDNLISREVDGIILVPCEGSEETVDELIDMNIPLVLLDRYFPGKRTNYVSLNNRKASYDATIHLIEGGYRNIGMVAYNVKLQHMQDRINGYKQAMTEKGLASDIQVKYLDISRGEKSTEKVVSNMMDNGMEAVVCATNNIAISVLYVLKDLGIKVPDQLAIVGFDGGSAFEFYYAPLSYIQQPLELMAQKAVEILLEQIESGSGLLQQVEFEGTLVKNASSAPKVKAKPVKH
jgi:LacI family transcriptional regulator